MRELRIDELEILNGGEAHPRRWEDTPSNPAGDRVIYVVAKTFVDVYAGLVEIVVKNAKDAEKLYPDPVKGGGSGSQPTRRRND